MILSKPYRNQLMKRIGAQLKAAREQAGMDVERAARLSHESLEFFLGVEAGDIGSFQKLRVLEMLQLFALYGKELVVSSQELPPEERYYNLQFYGKTELKNFLSTDQTITY